MILTYDQSSKPVPFFDAAEMESTVVFAGASASRSGSTSSTLSVAPGFILNEEPITLYRLELERLQYIFHFPEEVAFQLSAILP